ncbi:MULTISPECIES: ABC transporter permease [unclassified Streptomyces]|uniref:ABC transporter permease n=1 Tax=unclassified Streptomyces TaxID=2593676 RepID=UPI003D8F3F4C
MACFLTVLTLFTREWIEAVLNVDPDGGDGSLEWLIVVALAMVTVVFAVLARLEWRRTQPVNG